MLLEGLMNHALWSAMTMPVAVRKPCNPIVLGTGIVGDVFRLYELYVLCADSGPV